MSRAIMVCWTSKPRCDGLRRISPRLAVIPSGSRSLASQPEGPTSAMPWHPRSRRDCFAARSSKAARCSAPLDPTPNLASAEEGGKKLVTELGAPSIAALRDMPAAQIMAHIGRKFAAYGLRPAIDGWVLPRNMPEAIATGQQNGTELLLGSVANEGIATVAPDHARGFARDDQTVVRNAGRAHRCPLHRNRPRYGHGGAGPTP